MKNYREDINLYTDAYKRTDKRVGVAYVIPKVQLITTKRINDDFASAVYSAELVAVWLTLL